MSKDTIFKTPYSVTFTDGQTIVTEAHAVCPNRLYDGVDRLYFETYDPIVPVHGDVYHKWDMTTKFLYAWTIPMEHVSDISECEEPWHGCEEVAKLGRYMINNLK